MERWQLSQKELARYGIIENTIEGYLKLDPSLTRKARNKSLKGR